MTGLRAAVDCGTNSTRLLIIDDDGNEVVREQTITRLGYGVDERGHLDDDALTRTLDALARYRRLWEEQRVDGQAIRIGATSAIRDASDRDRFFDAVREVTGIGAEVITGEEEARLSFGGAAAAIEAARPLAVIDIGGGSTELIVGDEHDAVVASHSMQLGSVRITERILRGDPPTHEEIAAARTEITARLREADGALAAGGADVSRVGNLVAVAGTPTILAALHLGLEEYEASEIHGTEMPSGAVQELAGELLAMRAAERLELPPIEEGRQDVIAGGALILAATLDRYRLPAVVISHADILNGLAASVELTSGASG